MSPREANSSIRDLAARRRGVFPVCWHQFPAPPGFAGTYIIEIHDPENGELISYQHAKTSEDVNEFMRKWMDL